MRLLILAILASALSVHAAVEVITADNFAEKSHAPVAWLLHLDGGVYNPASELSQLVANFGKYAGTLFPQGDMRVGHIDLESEPQLRQAFCGSGAAACPPLVLLPLWSGGRGRLQTQRSKVYTGSHTFNQASLVELVQFVKAERMPSDASSATMTQASQAQAQAQAAQAAQARAQAAPSQGASSAAPSGAELQAWLQTKPALLEAVRAGKLSAAQLQQVKQMAQQEIAQMRSATSPGESPGQQRAAPVDPRDAGSTPAPDARGGGGGGGGGGGRQSERSGAEGGKGSGSIAGRAVAEEGGDPFDFSSTRLDSTAGKGKRAPKRRKSLSTGRRGAAAKKRHWSCLWLCRK